MTGWTSDELTRIGSAEEYLLVLIDVSILIVALPRIHHDLRFSPTGLSWAQSA